MLITLRIFHMLSGLAAGEPELFHSEDRVLGHLLLVAEDEDTEAKHLSEREAT